MIDFGVDPIEKELFRPIWGTKLPTVEGGRAYPFLTGGEQIGTDQRAEFV